MTSLLFHNFVTQMYILSTVDYSHSLLTFRCFKFSFNSLASPPPLALAYNLSVKDPWRFDLWNVHSSGFCWLRTHGAVQHVSLSSVLSANQKLDPDTNKTLTRLFWQDHRKWHVISLDSICLVVSLFVMSTAFEGDCLDPLIHWRSKNGDIFILHLILLFNWNNLTRCFSRLLFGYPVVGFT